LTVSTTLWQKCVVCLKSEMPSQQFNTWIRPILAKSAEGSLQLYAPNRFVQEWVREHFLTRITEVVARLSKPAPRILLEVASADMLDHQATMAEHFVAEETARVEQADNSEDLLERALRETSDPVSSPPEPSNTKGGRNGIIAALTRKLTFRGELNKNYTFNSFIQGKSNQIARAAAAQVASNPGGAYNPLFIYGGVGLGKTHLMHAIGNHLLQKNPAAKVVYLHSQTFVGSMVSHCN